MTPVLVNNQERLVRHLQMFLGFLLGLSVYFYSVFAPASVIDCAHHDQYRYFCEDGHQDRFKQERRNLPQDEWLRVIGRPVAAELEYQVFRSVKSLGDLKRFRLLTVGLVALASACWACWLQALGLGRLTAAALSAATFTLPAVSFTIFMTSLNHPVAFLLALASAALVPVAFAPASAWFWFLLRAVAAGGVAVGLFVIALLSYQPSAFVIFLPVFAALTLGSPRDSRSNKRLILGTLILTTTGGLIYFLFVRLHFGADFPASAPVHYRVALTPHLAENLYRFATRTLVSALNLWNIWPSSTLTLIVLGVIASGGIAHILLRMRSCPGTSTHRRALITLAAIPALLIISDLPMIASDGSKLGGLYRTHFACTALVLTLFFAAVQTWVGLLPDRYRARALIGAAVALSLVGGIWANYTFHMNCLNSNKELEFIRSRIVSNIRLPLRRIHVIGPRNVPLGCNGCRKSSPDEFNVYSTSFQQDVPHIVRTALLSLIRPSDFIIQSVPHTSDGLRQIQPNTVAVTYSDPDEGVLVSPGMIVIDMNELVKQSLAFPENVQLVPGRTTEPAASRADRSDRSEGAVRPPAASAPEKARRWPRGG